jgi:integrase
MRVREGDLTESTLLDYVRFQSGQQPRPSPSIINDRVAVADRAIRNEFPDAPCQIARGFHHVFLQRKPMGLGRPRVALSRLRVKVPKRNIVPLSVNEVSRFWSSFRTSRDLAIVGLMLLQGLRSAEVLALNRDDASPFPKPTLFICHGVHFNTEIACWLECGCSDAYG